MCVAISSCTSCVNFFLIFESWLWVPCFTLRHWLRDHNYLYNQWILFYVIFISSYFIPYDFIEFNVGFIWWFFYYSLLALWTVTLHMCVDKYICVLLHNTYMTLNRQNSNSQAKFCEPDRNKNRIEQNLRKIRINPRRREKKQDWKKERKQEGSKLSSAESAAGARPDAAPRERRLQER